MRVEPKDIIIKGITLEQILINHNLWLENKGGKRADLSDANLSCANLRNADLRYADLRNANIDFSQLDLSCRGLNFKIDERLAKQIAYHLVNLMQYSKLDTKKWFKKQVYKDLETSHLVIKHELPILKENE